MARRATKCFANYSCFVVKGVDRVINIMLASECNEEKRKRRDIKKRKKAITGILVPVHSFVTAQVP